MKIAIWSLSWHLTRFRVIRFVLGLSVWIIDGIIPIFTGLLIKAIFDALTNQNPLAFNIWVLLALFSSIQATGIITYYGTKLLIVPFWYMCTTLLRQNMLQGTVLGPGHRSLPGTSSEAVSRFRDDPTEMVEFIDRWTDGARTIVFITLALGIMCSINPWIAVTVSLPVMAMRWITQLFDTHLKRYHQHNREASGQLTSFLGETFGTIQAIQATTAEGLVIDKFYQLNQFRGKADLKDKLFDSIVAVVNSNVVNFAVGLTMILAAGSLEVGKFTVGDFVLFISYLSSMTTILYWFGDLFTKRRHVEISIARMSAFTDQKKAEKLVEHRPVYLKGAFPSIPSPIQMIEPPFQMLEVSDLTHRYITTGRGIEGINLCIKRGQCVVITGRIGSGKTTLLRTLLGLLPQERGQIFWNSQQVDDPATFFIPPRCTYTAQKPKLLSETIKENILLGIPEDQVSLASVVQQAVLEQDLGSFRDGLDTLIGSRGMRLSGGQLQRIAAARMLVRLNEFLIVDDLSSALDVETEQQLWENLLKLDSLTILAVSHRPAVLKRADRILVLKNGQIEADGLLDDLLLSSKEMQSLWSGDIKSV